MADLTKKAEFIRVSVRGTNNYSQELIMSLAVANTFRNELLIQKHGSLIKVEFDDWVWMVNPKHIITVSFFPIEDKE